MKDADCTVFLRWALPRMGFRWAGFRKVRRQVCKRIDRRLKDLGLVDLEAYRVLLDSDPDEWSALDSLCRVTISRFYRDRVVFDDLRKRVLPDLARCALKSGREHVRCWSAGCASGEEPYTLQIIWKLGVSGQDGRGVSLHIAATDADPHLLKRAEAAVYPSSSLKDLPDELAALAFDAENGRQVLKPEFRSGIEWLLQDIRHESPAGPFDLVLCRNLAFTYFEESIQRDVLDRIDTVMSRSAYLAIGSHEQLPAAEPLLFRPFGRCWLEKIGSGP